MAASAPSPGTGASASSKYCAGEMARPPPSRSTSWKSRSSHRNAGAKSACPPPAAGEVASLAAPVVERDLMRAARPHTMARRSIATASIAPSWLKTKVLHSSTAREKI